MNKTLFVVSRTVTLIVILPVVFLMIAWRHYWSEVNSLYRALVKEGE